MEETGQQAPRITRSPATPTRDSRTRVEQQSYRIKYSEDLRPPATDRFLRINQVLEIIPVSRSTWWQKVKEGHYPKGVKLSKRTTAWRESEIMALIERLTTEARGTV